MAVMAASCRTAVNPVCRDANCKKSKCPSCKKHICPICFGHYCVMAYSEDIRGCSTACVKISTGDDKPWQGPVKEYKLNNTKKVSE